MFLQNFELREKHGGSWMTLKRLFNWNMFVSSPILTS